MDCPICHEHSLRNKTENGVRYRHCKGCGWQKVVKDNPTVMDEVKELTARPTEIQSIAKVDIVPELLPSPVQPFHVEVVETPVATSVPVVEEVKEVIAVESVPQPPEPMPSLKVTVTPPKKSLFSRVKHFLGGGK